MCQKTTNGVKTILTVWPTILKELMEGVVFQNYCFGSKIHTFGEKPFKNGGRYYWIVLAKELVQAIAEWNVYTKFEENWSRR